MLRNAMLVEITRDAVPIGEAGLPLAVALTPPTARDLRWLSALGIAAAAVVFVASQDSPALPAVLAGDVLRVSLAGHPEQTWLVVHVVQRAGSVIRYVQIFVTPATEP